MKVAFVSQPGYSQFPPAGADSIGLWTYAVARQLARSHHDVTVYGRGTRQQRVEERHEGVRYWPIPEEAIDAKYVKYFQNLDRWGILPPKRPFVASRFYYWLYIRKIAKAIRDRQCDIVHIHNFSQFVPVIRAFNPDIQIVLHMHCEWLTQLHAPTIEKRLEQVDLILGCSPYITKTIQQKFPQFSDRSQTVVNGVDVDAFANTAISAPTDGLDLQADKSDRTMSQSQKQQRLLFVGRVSPEKGVHVLLDAFRDVVARFPQAQLTIVGPNRNSCRKEKLIQLSDDPRVQALERFYPGPYMKHLRSHLPEGFEQQIRFTGAVPHQQLPDYYRQADILINPSLSEASGVSLLEAMAMGLPVIGARIGGMPDNIEAGKTGLLVEPDNASALAQAIAQLLADNELRASMGRAGRQRAIAHFAWERVTEGLLGHYTHIITGHEPVSSDPADAAVVPQIATAESQTL